MTEQIAPFDERHQEVYAIIILEYEVHAHYEWMLHIIEDVLLQFEVTYKLMFKHYIFSNSFHSVNLVCSIVLD